MTEEILTIREEYINDDSVESFQYIEIDCDNGAGNLNNETDLTITCQNKSAWLYPHASYLRIDGDFKTAAGAKVANNNPVAFTNNGLMHLFSILRYYLEGKQIEYFQNVGITTTIHNYLTKKTDIMPAVVGFGFQTGAQQLQMLSTDRGELEICL